MRALRRSRGVPYLRVTAHPDGSADGRIVGVQLELELGVNHGPPQLIIAPSPAVGGASEGPTIQAGVLPLGPVLAQVLEFHEAFDLPRQPRPTTQVGDVLATLRVSLLREETEEFAVATEKQDIVAIADALADVVYVAYGSAVTYGIDLDAVIAEVHRSNMSKLDEHGRPVLRADGKVLKSHRYRPPDVDAVLDGQLGLFGDPGTGRPRPAAARSVGSAS
jgi:predicted HAD superfamily Cof-like phosphohydrolase